MSTQTVETSTFKHTPRRGPLPERLTPARAHLFEIIGRAWSGHPAALRQLDAMISACGVTDREAEGARLRIQGKTFAVIGLTLGISTARASQLWAKTERALLHGEPSRATRQRDRLDAMVGVVLDPLPEWVGISCDAWEERGDAPWTKGVRPCLHKRADWRHCPECADRKAAS